MPFESRLFAFTPNDASLKYDRRDIYLVGSDASWDEIGLKLRDVEPKGSITSGTQSGILELKFRSEETSGVEAWSKVLKNAGSFPLGDSTALLKCAAKGVPANLKTVHETLNRPTSHFAWVAVDKRVRKDENSAFGVKETSWLRITVVDASEPESKPMVYQIKTYSAEARDPSGPALFLKTMRKEQDVTGGYPSFLRRLCRTCLPAWAADAELIATVEPISAELLRDD